MDLSNTVALITGAGSGIGKAAALYLAARGAKVAALGRTEDELSQTVDTIKRAGGEALALIADITQPDEMQQAVDQTLKTWGKLTCVFANAGINGVWAPIEPVSYTHLDVYKRQHYDRYANDKQVYSLTATSL